MTDDRLRKAYQARAAASRAGSPPTPEEIAALVAGAGSEEERLTLLDRVLADPTSARAFELLRAIAATEQGEQRARVRRWTTPLALAATVIVAVAGIFWLRSGREEIVRAPDASGVPTAATPADSAARPAGDVLFAWHPLAGAKGYRLELLTEAGTVVATSETADTFTSVSVLPGGPYRWVVVGLLPEGREVVSRARRLILVTP